jgi:IS30 family transposase
MRPIKYQKWSDADRERLVELAAVCSSNEEIAELMGRTASAVDHQRSLLRIKLKDRPYSRERVRAPHRGTPRPPIQEPPSRVDRLMRLAAYL